MYRFRHCWKVCSCTTTRFLCRQSCVMSNLSDRWFLWAFCSLLLSVRHRSLRSNLWYFFGSANALVTLFLVQQLVFLCFARIFCNDKPYRYWSMILLSFLKLSAISSTPVCLVKFVISFRIRQRFGNIVPSTTSRFSVFCDTFLRWQTLLIHDAFSF